MIELYAAADILIQSRSVFTFNERFGEWAKVFYGESTPIPHPKPSMVRVGKRSATVKPLQRRDNIPFPQWVYVVK